VSKAKNALVLVTAIACWLGACYWMTVAAHWIITEAGEIVLGSTR